MDCSMPGFPVLHHLPDIAQTHVHWVSDTIQPSHSLLPSSPPALSLSQHHWSFPVSQLFSLGGQSVEASASGSVLPMNIQGWFPLGLTSLISLLSEGPSRVFSNTIVQKHQFFGVQPSLGSNSLQPHGLWHARLHVLHYLPEFAQTHVHWVSDTIQPSHLLSSPSPPAFNFSQHQSLFKWVSPSHEVAKDLEFQLQHLSFQWKFKTDFL